LRSAAVLGEACLENNDCTDTGFCDTGTGLCADCGTGTGACGDGAFCNGAEVCNGGTGVCDPGTAPTLDDGIGCTDDSCDEVNDVVVNATNDATCDDGAFCNGAETCSATLDCQAGTAPTLDDGIGCTDDSCDEVNDVVVNATNDATCDDGAFCNGAETCSATLDCQAGTAPTLTDSLMCTLDACNETTNVVDHTAVVCPTDEACDVDDGSCQLDSDGDGIVDNDDLDDDADGVSDIDEAAAGSDPLDGTEAGVVMSDGGGTVTTASGVEFDVPSGAATPATATITVTLNTVADDTDVVSEIWDVEASVALVFDPAAQLTIPYDDSTIGGAEVAIGRLQDIAAAGVSTSAWIALEGCTVTADDVTCAIEQLGTYAVMIVAAGAGADAGAGDADGGSTAPGDAGVTDPESDAGASAGDEAGIPELTEGGADAGDDTVPTDAATDDADDVATDDTDDVATDVTDDVATDDTVSDDVATDDTDDPATDDADDVATDDTDDPASDDADDPALDDADDPALDDADDPASDDADDPASDDADDGRSSSADAGADAGVGGGSSLDDGCGCRIPGGTERGSTGGGLLLLGLTLLGVGRRRWFA
jgi:MYXO-CTERM domain-containing protein